jgi:octaprenyl-diphosphate synthase
MHVNQAPALPFPAADAYPPGVTDDLQRVEERLSSIAQSSREPRLTEITHHLIGAGGKRVRPLTALLVFYACVPPGKEGRRDDMTDVATALELIHTATLLHDDIIDASDRRRGRPSALRQFGMADTLVAGDFVFCRAFELCARFEEKVVRWAADACVSLTEGEMLQSRLRSNPAVTVDDYLEIIARKTASLFSQGARVAAYLAGAEEATQELASDMGHHIGMTFQMIDDLLDVSGQSSLTGKPTSTDLRDGNPSLPIVLALQRDPEVRRLFSKPALDEQEIAHTVDRIQASGVLGAVQARADDHVALALTRLRLLPPGPARDALIVLAQGIANRSG